MIEEQRSAFEDLADVMESYKIEFSVDKKGDIVLTIDGEDIPDYGPAIGHDSIRGSLEEYDAEKSNRGRTYR